MRRSGQNLICRGRRCRPREANGFSDKHLSASQSFALPKRIEG